MLRGGQDYQSDQDCQGDHISLGGLGGQGGQAGHWSEWLGCQKVCPKVLVNPSFFSSKYISKM